MSSAALLYVNAGHALPLLLDVAAKSFLVSASALVVLVCLRRASAAMRHLVLLAGLGVLLGLPVLMALLPRQEFPRPVPAPHAAPAAAAPGLAPPAPTAPPISEAPATPVDTAPVAARPPLPAPPAITPAQAPAPPVRPAWLVLGWLVGVLICAGRMLAAQARVWWLTRRCPPLPPSLLLSAGLETACFAALLTGPTGTPPMVWGWPRPTLLLPPEAADWPDARQRAIFLHESAHVRRRDWLTQMLAQAACAVYWFNPLAWLLTARLGAEAERACDDAVLLAGVPPTDYAQDLLAVARHLGAGRTTRRASVGAVTMARRSPVRGRLEAILDIRRVRRSATRRSAVLALAVALAVAAPLAALRPAAHADEAPAGQAAPPGVPTEADIAKVQQHLHGLEQERADYAAAHSDTLTAAQVTEVDRLIEALEEERQQKEYDNFEVAQEASEYKRAWAKAKKPHTKKERQEIWRTIFGHDHPGPDRGGKIVAERNRIRNLRFVQSLAQLKRQVAALPAEQSARETGLYAFDGQIALDKTQIEAMQMERAEGYPLHFAEGEIALFAHMGLWNEKRGFGSRADWVLTELLNHKLYQVRHFDDADVDSLITLLREPGNVPSINLATVLALFRAMHSAKMQPVPPPQQQKIREAVTPFLTSHDKWPKLDNLEHKFAREVLDLYGGSAPTPPTQKAKAVPAAAVPPARPQSTPQAAQTGVRSMILPKSIKPALLKTAAFAALAAGLALPAAPAAPPAPAPKPEAPKPAAPASTAQAPTAQVPAAGVSLWASLLLRHVPLWKVRAFTGWDRGESLPEGVTSVYFLESNRSILVRATPAGITHMQGIIRRLDSLRPVQIRVAFATVTAADLAASGLHSDGVPPGGLGAAGKSPQLFMEGAEGSAVAAYLAALEKRKAVVVAPTITTDIGVSATISMETPSLMPGPRNAQVLITPRLDKEGVLTLQMTPPRSPRADAAGNALTPVPIVRPVGNGTTFVLVNPLPPAAGEGERYLLIFVTPTAMTATDPAMPPQMIP